MAASLLAGCGTIPMVAQQTTAAALAPFTIAAQAVGTDLQIVGRGMSALTRQTAQSSRQVATALNTNAAVARPVTPSAPSPISYSAPRATPTARTAKPKGPDDDVPDILPADLLKRLTPDQAGMQHAAQRLAMKATVGETIFWFVDGRIGTAMTENESSVGGFTCRVFVQTLALEDYFDKASLTACHNGDGVWTHSF